MRRRLFAAMALCAALGVACGDDSTASAPTEVTGPITVLAAASLTEPFNELASGFAAAHPGTKVTFSFASSSALATQINQGAPADVFASADTANMDKVTAPGAGGTAGPPVTFAKNRLQIIVGKGNPKSISGLADLAKPGVIYVSAAAGVPIGTYATQSLEKARVAVTPKSLEADVKAIVNKVVLGEADAGIVYESDVKAAGSKAQGVAIPEDLNVIASYPIAVLKSAKNAMAATAFVGYVSGPAGQSVLAKYGFIAP